MPKKLRRHKSCTTKNAGADKHDVMPLLPLLEQFKPGISRLAMKHGAQKDDAMGEAAIAYFDALSGYDKTRGSFTRRWWFLLSKRILRLSPRRSDALSHIAHTENLSDFGGENEQE